MENPHPRNYQLFGKFLAITWQDGHESLLPLALLRANCPCARCQGEPDLFGRRYQLEETTAINDQGYEMKQILPVGRYGLQFTWGDGHDTGIYPFSYLRQLCDCDECRAAGKSEIDPPDSSGEHHPDSRADGPDM